MKISVVIPVYKNKEQFLKNLKHNLKYLEEYEIIIVNDYPDESLKTDLQDFPSVKLFENTENLGFGQTVNRGVNQAHGDLVLLLNTDVLLKNDSFKKSVDEFKNHPNLFAISFAQEEKNGLIVGKNRFFWKQGMFFHSKANDLEKGINGWAEGGSCIIDRSKYLELEGFDKIYKPFYWEDIDLSYRAWKQGYEILFDPTILVEHHHESTIGRYFLSSYVKKIAFRNQFFFIWKNITDSNLKTQHFALLLPNLLYYVMKGEFNFFNGLLAAFKLKSTIKKGKLYKKSDKEILKNF